MKKRNSNKKVQFLAAAVLSAALVAGQIQPAVVYGGEETIQISSLIPDNVTIEEPIALSEISLPSSDYGTLSWADSSSVPSERVQTYEVVFEPYDSSVLSQISGWDGNSDVIYGSVTVVVSSISEESEEEYEESEDQENDFEEDGSDESLEDSSEDGSGSENTDENDTENENTENDEETSENSEPEATVTPEVTKVPEVTETPEATVTPDVTVTPEITKAPEVTGIPEVTVTPEAEETPEVTVTPELTVAPEATVTPETTVTPEAEETPEVTVTPEPTVTPEADKDNIFDRDEEKDNRPDKTTEELTEEEQQAAAAENHSCNGISVSGINLPWYVQFRATSGEDYEFSNEQEANVFKAYEFELWDLKNNTEYEIPDGEYISVTVPVKAGYTYTIEHLLDSGAMETIVPSVDGSTMIFSTHSFSPFGIAGSRPLVGEELQEDGYDGTSSSVDTARPTATAAPSADSSADNEELQEDSGSSQNNNSTANDNDSSEDQSDSVNAVNTGDNTPVGAFVILALAAIVIVGVILYLRKRKNN